MSHLPLDLSRLRRVCPEFTALNDAGFLEARVWHQSSDQSIPSGKHTKNCGKSPCLMGKSTISTGPFSIATLNYQSITFTIFREVFVVHIHLSCWVYVPSFYQHFHPTITHLQCVNHDTPNNQHEWYWNPYPNTPKRWQFLSWVCLKCSIPPKLLFQWWKMMINHD